jgi:hypothetical protein
MLFLMGFVVPRFAAALDDMRTEIPAGSRIILESGRWLGDNLGLVAGPALIGLLALAAIAALPATQQQFRKMLSRLPGVKDIAELAGRAQALRVTAALLAGGATVPVAFAVARETSGELIGARLAQATERVERGEPPSAGAVLGREDYLAAARGTANFLITQMRDENGRLLRSFNKGEAKLRAYLEDHAMLLEGLLALYEATFEPQWYLAAVAEAEAIMSGFGDPERGGFFSTASDGEQLVARRKEMEEINSREAEAYAKRMGLEVKPRTSYKDSRETEGAFAHRNKLEERPVIMGGGIDRSELAKAQKHTREDNSEILAAERAKFMARMASRQESRAP